MRFVFLLLFQSASSFNAKDLTRRYTREDIFLNFIAENSYPAIKSFFGSHLKFHNVTDIITTISHHHILTVLNRSEISSVLYQFIEDFPNSIEANFIVGCKLILNRRFDIAEEVYLNVLEFSKYGHLPSIINLAEMYIFTLNEVAASRMIREAFHLNEMVDETGLLSYYSGKFYQLMGRYEISAQWYLLSATIQQSNVNAWLFASTLLFPEPYQNLSMAEKIITLAFKQYSATGYNGSYIDVLYYFYGYCHQLMNKAESAIVHYHKSYELFQEYINHAVKKSGSKILQTHSESNVPNGPAISANMPPSNYNISVSDPADLLLYDRIDKFTDLYCHPSCRLGALFYQSRKDSDSSHHYAECLRRYHLSVAVPDHQDYVTTSSNQRSSFWRNPDISAVSESYLQPHPSLLLLRPKHSRGVVINAILLYVRLDQPHRADEVFGLCRDVWRRWGEEGDDELRDERTLRGKEVELDAPVEGGSMARPGSYTSPSPPPETSDFFSEVCPWDFLVAGILPTTDESESSSTETPVTGPDGDTHRLYFCYHQVVRRLIHNGDVEEAQALLHSLGEPAVWMHRVWWSLALGLAKFFRWSAGVCA